MKFDDAIRVIEEVFLKSSINTHDRGKINFFSNPSNEEWEGLVNSKSMKKQGALRGVWRMSDDEIIVWNEYDEEHLDAMSTLGINPYDVSNRHIYIYKSQNNEKIAAISGIDFRSKRGSKFVDETEYGKHLKLKFELIP